MCKMIVKSEEIINFADNHLHYGFVDELEQCRGLFGFVVFLCQQSADDFFQLWDEADEKCCVEDIETGVEHGQHDGDEGCLALGRG